MRVQTIQFSGEREASAFLATLDDDVSIDALTWGGRTTRIRLATDHAEQRHLLGDDVVRIVVGADPYDVEAHTLTLRFPSAEEAARFRTRVLAGTLLVGAIAAPAAIAISQVAASPDNVTAAPISVPLAAPVSVQALPLVLRAAPVVDQPEEPGFTLQSKGTSEATGEDNSSGSSVMWIHNTNTEIK